jgi:outer membrane receptor protein involved in Fe transport
MGMNWFDPSGLSASLTSTYWHQDGTFEGFFDHTAVRSGRDDFWTVDAAVGYRLPKRYGFLSVGATNLFDERFKFFEIDVDNPTIQPVRTFFMELTLAFP